MSASRPCAGADGLSSDACETPLGTCPAPARPAHRTSPRDRPAIALRGHRPSAASAPPRARHAAAWHRSAPRAPDLIGVSERRPTTRASASLSCCALRTESDARLRAIPTSHANTWPRAGSKRWADRNAATTSPRRHLPHPPDEHTGSPHTASVAAHDACTTPPTHPDQNDNDEQARRRAEAGLYPVFAVPRHPVTTSVTPNQRPKLSLYTRRSLLGNDDRPSHLGFPADVGDSVGRSPFRRGPGLRATGVHRVASERHVRTSKRVSTISPGAPTTIHRYARIGGADPRRPVRDTGDPSGNLGRALLPHAWGL